MKLVIPEVYFPFHNETKLKKKKAVGCLIKRPLQTNEWKF